MKSKAAKPGQQISIENLTKIKIEIRPVFKVFVELEQFVPKDQMGGVPLEAMGGKFYSSSVGADMNGNGTVSGKARFVSESFINKLITMLADELM